MWYWEQFPALEVYFAIKRANFLLPNCPYDLVENMNTGIPRSALLGKLTMPDNYVHPQWKFRNVNIIEDMIMMMKELSDTLLATFMP